MMCTRLSFRDVKNNFEHAFFAGMNLHNKQSCKMLFLIKVHKIDDFFKKSLKTLEKSANIMYLCKGG